jgi:hypothetical protein
MERSPTDIVDIAEIEPRLAWSLRLYPPCGELTRETFTARVCELIGIVPDLSEEEVDALLTCALMTQYCTISTGAPPDWEIAALVDAASGLVAQRVPVEVGQRFARRMLDAGIIPRELFDREFWLAFGGLIGTVFVNPLVEAGFVKVWATERVGRPPEPPLL